MEILELEASPEDAKELQQKDKKRRKGKGQKSKNRNYDICACPSKKRSSGGPKGRQAEPHKHPIYGKQKETHELIFSWLSWLTVLLVGAYARRRRRWSRATWRPYSK